MARHAIVIGGTGQIGRAVGRELLDHGWQVTLCSRHMRPEPDDLVARGAKIVVADRDAKAALSTAIGSGADAVIDTVAYTEAHADQLLAIQESVGAFAVISSCSVYRDYAGRTLDEASETGFPDFPDPITEKCATVDPGPNTYSTQKVALERRLLERSSRPITLVRAGAIHGTHSSHPREWWFVKRILDNRKVIPLAYRGQSRFHTAAAANIASLIRVALNQLETHVLNAADPTASTSLEIGTMIGRYLRYRGTVLPIDLGDDRGKAAVGWSPWSIPAPFVLSTDAAKALGYKPVTTYEECVGPICDWLVKGANSDWKEQYPVLASYPLNLFDYLAEDKFLSKT
jgi:nucleoside-diphosphate-sugar epimerase